MPADLNDYFKKKNGGGGNNSGGGNDGGNRKPNMNLEPPEFFKNLGKKAGLLYTIIGIIVVLVIAKPFAVINSGEVGIKATAGKYEKDPMLPGFHLFIPFLQKVFVVDTRVRIMNFTSSEDVSSFNQRGSGIQSNNAISVLDNRNLPVSLDLTIQYKLEASTVPNTIATWGFAWEDKIISPDIRDVVRSVVGKYAAEKIPQLREEIAIKIEEGIRTKIDSQPGQPVKLLSIQLREITLTQKIKDQIEKVQVEKQELERTRYEVERTKQEALKAAAVAEGVAQAKEINAKGIAKAVKIEADAAAYANIEIAKSITKELLSLKQIEIQGKFNDALRDNKDAKIFLTPGGAVPNIWIDTKNTQKTSAITQ